jgi:hypothetical protein
VGIVRFSRTILLETTFLTPTETALEGALALLDGETDGFAIDATTYDSVTAASYVGGPVGGTVATIDTGTPANDLSNVPLDASNLVNSGTSPKMVHNASSPYVRWSAHNYVEWSQEFDNADWTKTRSSISANATTAPDGTSTADKLIEDSTVGNTHYVEIGFSWDNSVGTTSVYAKAAERTWIVVRDTQSGACKAWFNLSNGTVGTTQASIAATSITSVGNGWYRCSITHSTAGGFVGVAVELADADNSDAYNGDGASGVYIWGMQRVKGWNANPYLVTTSAARIGIPLSYDAAAAQYGILVEPAGTNLAVRSEQLDNASWTPENATIDDDAVTAPDATSNADTMTAGGTATTHDAYVTVAYTQNTTITLSAYAKKGTCNYIFLGATNNSAQYFAAVFDINTGVVGETSVGATTGTVSGQTITAIGDGWYRCTVSGLTNGDAFGAVNFRVGQALAASGNTWGAFGTVTDAAANLTSHFWGMQAELGSVATSYIPTLGSTVTRAMDKVSVATTTFPYSDTTGTWVARYKEASQDTSNQKEILNRGTSGRYFYDYIVDTAVDLACYDGTNLTNRDATGTFGNYLSAGLAYSSTSLSLTDDGAAVTTGTFDTGWGSGNVNIGGEGLTIDSLPSGLIFSRIVFLPRRMTDGDLQTATST